MRVMPRLFRKLNYNDDDDVDDASAPDVLKKYLTITLDEIRG